MVTSSKNTFIGVLDGTDINEINQKINYDKTKLEDRKKVVNDILDNTEFYSVYYTDHFKTPVTASDPLSSDINVCRSLERMASYLLMSDEIKQEEDKEKTQYVFHTNPASFKKKVEKERSIESIVNSNDGQLEDSIIHFLKKQEPNHKKSKNQFISNRDLKRPDELGRILRDYNRFLEYITSEIKRKDNIINRYLLTTTKGQITNDMVYTKDSYLGTFGYDSKVLPDLRSIDYDCFDFTNMIHVKGKKMIFIDHKGKESEIEVKGLMFFEPGKDLGNDFNLVLEDFNNTAKKAGLSDLEWLILNELRLGTQKIDIAYDLSVAPSLITYYTHQIAKKIIKVGNKYDKLEEI